MRNKIVLMILLLGSTFPAFALNSYFCSAGNQYINVGATEDQVRTACGTPTKVIPYKPGASNSTQNQNADQIWTYNLVTNPMNLSTNGNYYQNGGNPMRNGINGAAYNTLNNNTNTIATFTVTIHQGNVSAVSTNKAACGNWNPYVGAPAQAVLNRCGQPISAQNATTAINPYKNKMETWIYTNPYGASLQLQLLNGQVTSMDLVSNQY